MDFGEVFCSLCGKILIILNLVSLRGVVVIVFIEVGVLVVWSSRGEFDRVIFFIERIGS